MKYAFIFLVLFTSNLKGQGILKFNKLFVECEDKWVAFQKDKDSTYIYGFIYIDAQAGLTLNYEGNFFIDPEGNFIPKKIDNANFKVRLRPNDVRVAWIPESKFKELQVIETPEWLKNYKTDTASIERLYRWGFLYNSWDQCAKALTYLEKAQKINPKFKGLEFELAYSYNDLEQYDKAIQILEKVDLPSSDDCYLYKELSFAQVRVGKLDNASESYKKSLLTCSVNAMKSEIAFNIAGKYYALKDKVNFKYWAAETKKWATKDDQFMQNINKMEAAIEL